VSSLGASINLFNLIPVWQLDGSRGLRALARGERWVLGAVSLATAAATQQWLPAIVGALVLVRSGARHSHPQGDRRVLALFTFLVVAHSLVARFAVSAPLSLP
jgi:Zn-dependent protease